jgi:hypothetical protein
MAIFLTFFRTLELAGTAPLPLEVQNQLRVCLSALVERHKLPPEFMASLP